MCRIVPFSRIDRWSFVLFLYKLVPINWRLGKKKKKKHETGTGKAGITPARVQRANASVFADFFFVCEAGSRLSMYLGCVNLVNVHQLSTGSS